MKLHHHTAFSVIISGMLYMIFKSWGLATACLISGIFIDLDHLIDYVRETGWPFKIKSFFQFCHKCQFRQIFLIWHGWEWVVLFGIAAWLTDWNPWITGTLIGLGLHIVLDTFYNGSNVLSYSLIWRWRKNFEFDRVFPKMKRIKYKYINFPSDEHKI